MPYRDIDQAKLDLTPFFAPFAAELDAAHAEFREKARDLLPKLEPRTQASMIRDVALRRMIEMCDREPGAQYIRKGQLGVIGLTNNWVVRIKKISLAFRVAVSKTNASYAYDINEVPASLQGVLLQAPPATCIYLGWAVPENAPHKIEKYLICNNPSGDLGWVIPLDIYSTAPPDQLFGPVPQLPGGEPKRVRIKEGGRRKANE